jgi:hypothetical protein
MKALQRFWHWAGNFFGKKVKETPSLPPAPEKTRTPLDEFVEVYSRLIDYPYFSPGFWRAWGKQEHIDHAVAEFKSLLKDMENGAFSASNNVPVDVNAVDGEEDISPEPVPTELYCEKFGWAGGEAEEHLAMLELAKKRAEKRWIAPLLCPEFKLEECALRPLKSKKPAKKKTKKAAKTRKKGKASQ